MPTIPDFLTLLFPICSILTSLSTEINPIIPGRGALSRPRIAVDALSLVIWSFHPDAKLPEDVDSLHAIARVEKDMEIFQATTGRA